MAFDEIAGISAAEESMRLNIAEAQAEAKRIVAQAELAGKTDIAEAREKRPESLPCAEPRQAPRRKKKHMRYI